MNTEQTKLQLASSIRYALLCGLKLSSCSGPFGSETRAAEEVREHNESRDVAQSNAPVLTFFGLRFSSLVLCVVSALLIVKSCDVEMMALAHSRKWCVVFGFGWDLFVTFWVMGFLKVKWL